MERRNNTKDNQFHIEVHENYSISSCRHINEEQVHEWRTWISDHKDHRLKEQTFFTTLLELRTEKIFSFFILFFFIYSTWRKATYTIEGRQNSSIDLDKSIQRGIYCCRLREQRGKKKRYVKRMKSRIVLERKKKGMRIQRWGNFYKNFEFYFEDVGINKHISGKLRKQGLHFLFSYHTSQIFTHI